MAIPCPYEDRILPISLGVSPCEICILSGSRKTAWPPRRVIPASNELRVRVEEKKKSINRVLSSRKRVGRSRPHFIYVGETLSAKRNGPRKNWNLFCNLPLTSN